MRKEITIREKRLNTWIWIISVVVPLAVAFLFGYKIPDAEPLYFLPPIYACINGFTALLLRNGEPNVVRSVTCTPAEQDDEIYRLLMFYHDRVAGQGEDRLNRFMVVGGSITPDKIREISSEALGRPLSVLGPEDVGLSMPSAGGLRFDDLAAPAGLAKLAYR